MYAAIEQQYGSNGTTAAVLQNLAFVRVTVYVCWCTAAGDRTTTSFHLQSNATTMKHTSPDLIPGSTQQQKKKQSPIHVIGTPVVASFRFASPPGYHVDTVPKGNLLDI